MSQYPSHGESNGKHMENDMEPGTIMGNIGVILFEAQSFRI